MHIIVLPLKVSYKGRVEASKMQIQIVNFNYLNIDK